MKLTHWIALSPLALALAAGHLRAEQRPAPTYKAEPCCNLCPAAHDASLYTTNYQKNFMTLVQAQGDWLFRTREDLRTEFDTSALGYRRMQQLHDAFARRGIELVLVYQPTRGLVNRDKLAPAEKARFDYDRALANYKAMLGRFEKMGYEVPDLSPLAGEQDEHTFYFRGDQHWTPYGAQRTAKIVADTIHGMPAFEGIPRREFVSKVIGRMGKKGTLHNVAGQLCGTSYAIEYMDQFATEPKDASGSDDLFGDSGNPQIVLVGTSHSGQNYNFAGFLQEHIGADVLNVAFPGGGLEGSMIEYLGSQEFRDSPPKILIWEFSPLYSLDQESIYRQLFALLDDGCEGKPAVLANKARLRPGKQEVLVNSGAKPIANRNGRIELTFADTSVKTVKANLWYLNGRRESVKLEKPATADTNGRFVFDLREDRDWADQNLLAVELEGPEAGGEPLEVEARLCQRQPLSQNAQAGL
ncbi:alginate O-acetyltransferase [Zestomonas carbonaria]|uniref:Alginate biosynthesis protein AlgX n=1 Tax=Zestomonas carbonaria TaxID=2762745 RepID=A0A7U7EP33_9GAMM|nr:alginate O-acetyltransferase [Pseudomonas carbonaria]CAD5108481.1 Alginate biosynthesis protein AlgX [Pseudomonas carbonaria]